MNASIDGGRLGAAARRHRIQRSGHPVSDLASGSNEFAELLSLGLPTSFGESGYSGGVDYST